MEPRLLRWILQIPVPSITAYARHNVRPWGVGQQYPPVIGTRDARGNPSGTTCTETQSANQRPDGGRPGSFWMAYGREHFAAALRLPTVGYREHRQSG
jgi:hypothetical protein